MQAADELTADLILGGDLREPPPLSQERIGDREGDDRCEGGEPTKLAGDPPRSELAGDAVATVESNKAHAAATFSYDGSHK